MSDATDPSRDADETIADDPVVYAVTLAPHRSLSPRGFLLVMGTIAVVSFGSGALFVAMGAWPVFGFFGLDVLVLYLAFRSSFRSARAREYIRVTASAIEVREVSARGRASVVRLNPFWTRIARRDDDELGTLDLALVCGPRQVPVGRCLGPMEKGRLASELTAALNHVKKGVVRSRF